jgi:hypothetical protein
MKRSLWSALLLGGMLLLTAMPAFCGQAVTVKGMAAIADANLDAARTSAIADACRNAVKEGIGVWIKSDTTVQDSAVIRDQILQHAQGYVTNYDVVKEGGDGQTYTVTIRATVATEQIGADFKKIVGILSTQLASPSIAFVLTTWESKGKQGMESTGKTVDVSAKTRDTAKYDASTDAKASGKIDDSIKASESEKSRDYSATSDKVTVDEKVKSNVNASGAYSSSTSAKTNVSGSASDTRISVAGREDVKSSEAIKAKENSSLSASGKVATESKQANATSNEYAGSVKGSLDHSSSTSDKGQSDISTTADRSLVVNEVSNFLSVKEDLWKKYPDPQIIDAFQQEFKEKNFQVMAADKAREIALVESGRQTSVDAKDRVAVAKFAQKEGANYVARGEVRVLDTRESTLTGNIEVTAQIGIEIIDVDSADIVAAYTNTVTSSNLVEREAKAQAIIKAAVVGARTLAKMTIESWQDRALNGSKYVIEVRNVTSARGQQRPFVNILASCGVVVQTTNPTEGVCRVVLKFKGSKNELENAVVDKMDKTPGFSEADIDGPEYTDGAMAFKFLKK